MSAENKLFKEQNSSQNTSTEKATPNFFRASVLVDINTY